MAVKGLSVVLWPEGGDFPENWHCVVCVINKKKLCGTTCLMYVKLNYFVSEIPEGGEKGDYT